MYLHGLCGENEHERYVHAHMFFPEDIEVRRRIHAAWRRFALAEDSAEAFVDLVLREYGRGDRQGGAPPSKLSRIFGASGHAPWIEDRGWAVEGSGGPGSPASGLGRMGRALGWESEV